MIANTGRAGRWMGWKLIAVVASALLLALLLGAQPSHAQSGGGPCLRDAADFDQPNICRANDVRIVEIARVDGPTSCEAGTTIDVRLGVTATSGANIRYDIGLYIAEDGGNAMDRGALCYRDYLHPVSADNSDLDLTTGDGPFYNGEIGVTPTDTCGDIDGDGQDTYYILGPITLTCSDGDGNGFLDLGTVVSWDNQDRNTCNDESDAVPNQTSKCRAQTTQVSEIRVEPSTATLLIQKVLQPPGESGFNLWIDQEVRASDVGHGGTTGPVEVSASDVGAGELHTVAETAVFPISLADYDTRIHCVDEDDDEFSANDSGPLSVYLQPFDEMTCTITNTLRGAGIEIEKMTDPPGSPGTFFFTNNIDAEPVPLDHGDRVLYDEELQSGGVYTFTEVVPEDWNLADISCTGAVESNVTYGETSVTITFFPGERIDCTFTDEPLVSLAVTKTADPTSVYEPGEWVDFEVVVNNTGPVPLTLTSLSDDVYGDIADAANPSLNSTDCSLPHSLAAAGSYTCQFEGEVTGCVGDEQTDTVTATAMDAAGGEVTAQDQATVLILSEPPPTGIGFATSLIVSALVAAGVALLALGLLMRRRMPRTR